MHIVLHDIKDILFWLEPDFKILCIENVWQEMFK